MLGVWEYFFTSDQWGNFSASTGISFTSTEWHIFGLYGIWATMPIFVSSSTSAAGAGEGRRLISPTGFKTSTVVVRF